ncbi:hypothetical protein ACWCXB_06165 [Streptomyces sp. NPDC001514]
MPLEHDPRLHAPRRGRPGYLDHLTSLNEVTENEVKSAAVNYSYFTGLRSLFRALRRERRILRDPARNVHLTAPVRVPRAIPSDRLRGLLEQVPGAKDKLALVLVAVYAIRPKQVAEIRLDDLNRSTGRLRIRRPNRLDHEVCLDEFALQLVKHWLVERHHRWPLSANPYLIVSPITACTSTGPPSVSPTSKRSAIASESTSHGFGRTDSSTRHERPRTRSG